MPYNSDGNSLISLIKGEENVQNNVAYSYFNDFQREQIDID